MLFAPVAPRMAPKKVRLTAPEAVDGVALPSSMKRAAGASECTLCRALGGPVCHVAVGVRSAANGSPPLSLDPRGAVMAGLTPGQEEADGGGKMFKLPPVYGWCWTSDRLAISREWAASKKNRRAPWNVIPYPAVSSVYRDGKGIGLSRPDGLAVAIGSTALKSLEACTLVADGLSSNPAAAPAAAELLKPYLKTARDRRDAEIAVFARRHKVDTSGTTHTLLYSARGFRLVTGTVCAVLGAGLLAAVVVTMANPTSSWAQGNNTSENIWGTAMSLLLIWVGLRLARARLQINSEKVAIHSYLYNRTVNASKIYAIRLQAKDYEGGPRWIFRVELTSGTGFGIESFDCGSARNPPIPELAAIVEEIRVLLGVSADDAGKRQTPQPEVAGPEPS